jgi:hypothetical protein
MLARSLARPLAHSLTRPLAAGDGPLHEPDSTLYVTAIEAALGTPIATALPNATGDPKAILSDFFEAEKIAGRWTGLKRLWLHIYANAAANAIDLRGCSVAPFVNSPTHNATNVKYDGTSQYFNFNATPSALGLSMTSATYGYLCTTSPTLIGNMAHLGAQQSGTQSLSLLTIASASLRIDCGINSVASVTANLATQNGIVVACCNGTNASIYRRTTAGFSTLVSSTVTPSGTMPTVNIYGAARNVSGTASNLTDGAYGSWFCADGMTSAEISAFSASLKTLYESLTGTSIP